jgi:hypothetical protein
LAKLLSIQGVFTTSNKIYSILVEAAGYSNVILNQEIKTAFDITYGDVSGDGNITAGDATLILRYVVGLIQMFPVEVQ